MPIIQRNTTSLSNLVYNTGIYVNPSWILSLSASKVGSGTAQWNASQLQGYPIYTGVPSSGQVLSWTSSGWFPSGVTGSAVATGVTSFNSRTGIVTLTLADVTGALTYTPYNNTNPSGYISSGYYTANGGVTLSGSNFSMGGTGTLHQLVFDDDVIRVGNQAGNNSDSQYSIMIGRQAGVNSTDIYSIMLGTFAGTKASGSYNTLIGYAAGCVADPYSSGIGSNNLEISSSGSDGLASILSGKSNKINIQETIVGDNTTKKLAIGNVGSGNLNPNSTLEIIPKYATDKVLIAKGAISQTANLIEAQSSSGTTLFSVNSSGYISTPSSGVATWNASQLKGYAVSGNIPTTGQVLTWNGTSWYAADITAATALTLNYLQFNPLNNDPTAVEGRIWYDNDNHTLAYFNDSLTASPIHLGQDNVIRVYNTTTGVIPKGSVVYINGSHSSTPTVDYALADINQTRLVIAVASQDLQVNSYGYVTSQGIITDLNTHDFTAGDAIYLSPTVPGGYTNVVPTAPDYAVQIGNVLYAHPTHGSIFVCPVLESVRGDHIIGDIYASPSGKIFTGNVLLNGAISGVLSNTTITPIDSTPYASGDCIKYIIKAKYGSAVQATEVLVVSNGTDSYMTEYGLLYSSGKLLDVSADLNSSNIRLLGQATYSNTSIHMMKVLLS